MGQCLITRKGGSQGKFVTLNKGDQLYGGSRSITLDKVYKKCIIVVASCIGGNNGGLPSITVSQGQVDILYSLVDKGAYNNYVTYRIYKGTNVGGTLTIPNCGYGVAYSLISLEKISGSGKDSKEYIYKDGTFFIEPTTNTLQNVNGHLTGTNDTNNTRRIIIPYAKANKKIFYKFINSAAGTNTGSEVGIGSTNPSQDSNTWSPYVYNIISRYSANNEVIISCLSNEIIYLNIYKNTLYCTEIWTEDIG